MITSTLSSYPLQMTHEYVHAYAYYDGARMLTTQHNIMYVRTYIHTHVN